MSQQLNSRSISKKQERIFVNTFWHSEEVRAKIMAFAEREGIVPTTADVEAQMDARMRGHSIHDDYMC